VLLEVEAGDLGLLVHPDADGGVEDLEDEVGHHEREHDDDPVGQRLLAEDLIPVISTIGTDAAGQAYNINADTGAGAVAEALGAHKVIYLTDVEGLRLDADDSSTLVSEITTADLQHLVDDGVMTGGMIPKIAACIHAVEHGVGSAHILDGRVPHVVLLELFTDAGIGTMVTGPTTGATT